MDLFDVGAIDKAEASIDAFIEKRAKENEEANAEEAAWAESTRRFNEKRHRQNARARYDYHDSQVASHEATFAALDSYHRGERARYAALLGFAVPDGQTHPGPEAA